MILDGNMLKKLFIGPKEINFGEIFKGSEKKQTFWAFNNLRFRIFIEFTFDIPELSKRYYYYMIHSYPPSMVINPGCTEAFTLVFFSREVKSFNFTLKYTINYRQAFKLKIKAEVKSVTLKVSTNALRFQFKNEKIGDKAEFTQIQKLKLVNSGNGPATFNWEEPSKKNFSISPMTGVVQPNKNSEVDIAFTALDGIKGDIEDLLKCNLENGNPFTVNVTGFIQPSKCSLAGSNTLNFDCIHVGIEESKEFVIKNDSKNITAFSIVFIKFNSLEQHP